jgi:hypothetical protein
MPYNTPELLLVGSAETLVLQDGAVSDAGSQCGLDNPEPFTSDLPELW